MVQSNATALLVFMSTWMVNKVNNCKSMRRTACIAKPVTSKTGRFVMTGTIELSSVKCAG